MTPKDNILQELRDLQSPLSGYSRSTAYGVPAGYFDGLAEQVLNRIRAMEAATAAEEVGYLSPLLSRLDKAMPYTVPQGYFEGMEDALISAAMHGDRSANKELEAVSPLLSGLKKEMPFSVPDSYFENVSVPAENKSTAKVVTMGSSRKWFRYAAAAVVTGVIALSVILLNNDKVTIDPNENSHEWVKKNTEKIKTDNIEEFIQLTSDDEKGGQEAVAVVETKIKDVKELIKDVPENEIQDFMKDTEVLDEPVTNFASDESMKP